MRTMVSNAEKRSKARRDRKLSAKVLRQKAKLRLKNKRTRERLRKFIAEVRARNAEGYSASQLLKSYIPDLGGEDKIPEAEVTAEVTKQDIPKQLIGFFLK